MRCVVFIAVVLVAGLASAAKPAAEGPKDTKDWWDAGITVAQRSLQECEAAKDVASCIKVKALRVLDRALNAGPLPLIAGVAVVKRPEVEGDSRSARALPALPGLPRDAGRRSAQLDDLLAGRIARFLETRSLQVSLPKLADTAAEVFEGRGKLKKMAGPAILIMVMAAYKLAMMMAGVAMLSGKALIVSKVALTLAGVAVLKKLLSHGEGHEKTTVEIVKTPQVSHSHSYSSHHDHDDGHGYHDKSWNVAGMPYTHRSLTEEGVDALGQTMGQTMGQAMGQQHAALMPQEMAIKRDYRSVTAPMNFVTGRGVESLSIRSHDPLRIVVADNGEDHIRVLQHRQRQLDLPAEEPLDYSQFGQADTGAWRGIGTAIPVGDSRSLGARSAPSSEQEERSTNDESSRSTYYQPRSLSSYSLPEPFAVAA